MQYDLSIRALTRRRPKSKNEDILNRLWRDDVDIIMIDRLLLDGYDPEGAVREYMAHGTPVRRREGLRTLARTREEEIMSALGDSVDDLIALLKAGKEISVHPRRVSRILESTRRARIEVEEVCIIRPIMSQRQT